MLTVEDILERQNALLDELKATIEHIRVIEGALQQVDWTLERMKEPEEK